MQQLLFARWIGFCVACPSACKQGVLKAVANVNDILAPKLLGMDVTDQSRIDKLMVEECPGGAKV